MITLQAGPDRVAVDPDDGARLVSWVAGGRERLVARSDATDADFGHGVFVMAPWAGRIAGGRLHWDGVDHLLPRRMQGNAIHGLVDESTWTVAASTTQEVRLVHRIHEPAGPWTDAVVTHHVALEPGRLRLRLALQAPGADVPVALGWHPCFQRPSSGEVSVTVPADHTLDVDDQVVPTGRLLPVAGDTDLRDGPALGDRRLDDTWIGVEGPLRVSWPDLDLTMQGSAGMTTAVVFTPPTHLCVEPQSAWPDPVRLAAAGHDTGVVRVAAGRSVSVTTTWTWVTR